MSKSPEKDRRRHPRFPIAVPGSGNSEQHGDLQFVTGNISMGGAYCHTTYRIPEMTRLSIEISLPRDDEKIHDCIHVDAIVVRVEPEERDGKKSYRMALLFTNLSGESKQKLKTYLAGSSEQASS